VHCIWVCSLFVLLGEDLHWRLTHTHDTLYEFPLYGSALEFDILALYTGHSGSSSMFSFMYIYVFEDDHSNNHYYLTTYLCNLWSLKRFFLLQF
jgi:hypothetical protein